MGTAQPPFQSHYKKVSDLGRCAREKLSQYLAKMKTTSLKKKEKTHKETYSMSQRCEGASDLHIPFQFRQWLKI